MEQATGGIFKVGFIATILFLVGLVDDVDKLHQLATDPNGSFVVRTIFGVASNPVVSMIATAAASVLAGMTGAKWYLRQHQASSEAPRSSEIAPKNPERDSSEPHAASALPVTRLSPPTMGANNDRVFLQETPEAILKSIEGMVSADRKFHQANSETAEVWNVECSTGKSYVVNLEHSGHIKVLPCATLERVSKVDCFRSMDDQKK